MSDEESILPFNFFDEPEEIGPQMPNTNISIDEFHYSSIEEVFITFTLNPEKFYVRKTSLIDKFETLCEDLNKNYSIDDLDRLIEQPKIGMKCIVSLNKSGSDPVWYRGLIKFPVGRGLFFVFLTDVGQTVIAHWTKLRYILPKYTSIKALAKECHLVHLKPRHEKWSDDSIKYLQSFENRILVLHVDNERQGSIGVTLYDISDRVNTIRVNTEMIERDFATSFRHLVEKRPEIPSKASVPDEAPRRSKFPLILDIDHFMSLFQKRTTETRYTRNQIESMKKEIPKSRQVPKLPPENRICNSTNEDTPAACTLEMDLTGCERDELMSQMPKFIQSNNYSSKVHSSWRNKIVLNNRASYPPPTARSVDYTEKRITGINELPIETLETNIENARRLQVSVVYYYSPSLLYVSLNHQDSLFNELHENMRRYYTYQSTQSQCSWAVGDRCCSQCVKWPIWRRAVILELVGENAKVLYSDFAFVVMVPLSSLRQLDPAFQEIGDAAFKCHLYGISTTAGYEGWMNITKKCLKELLDGYRKIFIIKMGNSVNNSWPVKILVEHVTEGGALDPDIRELRSLNDKILEFGFALPDNTPQQQLSSDTEGTQYYEKFVVAKNILRSVDEWLQVEPESLIDENLPKNEYSELEQYMNFPKHTLTEFMGKVIEIENHNSFLLTISLDDETIEAYDEMYVELDLKGPTLQPLDDISQYKACVALHPFKETWYRATVLEYKLAQNLVKVRYVDNGDVETLPISDVREISSEFTILPPKTMKAALSGVKEGPAFSYDLFEAEYTKTFFNQAFRTKVIDYSGSVPYIELRSESEELIYADLIEKEILLNLP